MVKTLNALDITLINTIRRNPDLIKSRVAEKLGVSWSTVSSSIKDLANNNLLSVKENEGTLSKTQKAIYKATVSINKNYEHYIGISVGSSNIKIVFLGFDFSYLSSSEISKDKTAYNKFETVINKYKFSNKNSVCNWCTGTPASSGELCHILIEICDAIYELKKAACLNVGAITFTFPGHIDFAEQKIISTSNLCNKQIQNANITRLITSTVLKKLNDIDIDVFIDHNIKSCTIAEQEYLFTSNDDPKNNILVVYLGKGVGIGMILNNQLYRGNRNTAGELGHIAPREDGRELEEIIWNDIFNNNNNFEALSSDDLKNYISNHPDKKIELINLLADTIKNIVQILGVNDIIFSGKFDALFEEIEMELISKFEDINFPGLILGHSHYGEYSAAVGAAMSCFNNKYKVPFVWN